MLNFTVILGVKITTSKEGEILRYIEDELAKPKEKRQKIIIFTPNPEQISAAAGDVNLKNLLNRADIALPDGIGVIIATRLLGKPIEARITGIDFMKNLIKTVSNRPVVAGFFGGQQGVAKQAWDCLQKTAPRMTLGYASDVYEKQKMIQSDIDILFVGLGFPKQERWILEHKDEIPATVFMAVGGAFDFLSGRIVRAPKFVRNFGFEWLFRLIRQPLRFFRQLRLLHFGGLILMESLGNRLKRFKT